MSEEAETWTGVVAVMTCVLTPNAPDKSFYFCILAT